MEKKLKCLCTMKGKVQKLASGYRDRQNKMTTVLQLQYKQRVKDDNTEVCEIKVYVKGHQRPNRRWGFALISQIQAVDSCGMILSYPVSQCMALGRVFPSCSFDLLMQRHSSLEHGIKAV